MKFCRFFFCLILILGLNNLVFAGIKARIGVFIPVESFFREIYGTVGPTYEIELDQSIFRIISIWENANFTHMQGNSISIEDETSIYLVNFSIGPKFSQRIYGFIGYVGAGIVGSGVWIKNNNSSCCKNSSNFEVGGVVQTGVSRYFLPTFFVDFFADYYFQPVKYQRRMDLKGFRTGVGIGHRF